MMQSVRVILHLKSVIAFEIGSSGAKHLVKELNIDAEDIVMIMPMTGG